MFQLGRHMTSKGNIIAPGPLDLGADPVLDQHQPRADLRPAAADLGGGLLEPGVRAALPAHGAPHRDQAMQRLPPLGGQRQQCDHGAAAAAGHQLRQLRRPPRLDRAGERVRGGAGHRMGRAAGGDRLLSPPLRLSRLLPAARRAQPSRADQLDARRDLRPQSFGRDPPARANSATSSRAPARRSGCLQNRGEYMFVAMASGGFRVYRRRQHRQQGLFRADRHRARLAARPGHPCRARRNATCMALPTNQPIAPSATADGADDGAGPERHPVSLRDANQEQAFHPIYHYAVVTDAVEGLYLVNVDTLADGEPRNNFLRRAVTWNENRRADRRAPRHARRPLRLYRRRPRASSSSISTIRCTRATSPPCRSPTRAPRRCSSAISG